MEIKHAQFSSDTLLERWKAPTNFAWYPYDNFGPILKILCKFWKSDRVNTLQMTFRHSHHKNGTLKSDHLNDCFQFSEPRIRSLKSDRVNRPFEFKSDEIWVSNPYLSWTLKDIGKPFQMVQVLDIRTLPGILPCDRRETVGYFER